MFTPELVNEKSGEFILVSNHYLETRQGLELSIKYNKARIKQGISHLPENIKKCRLVYDIRGQNVDSVIVNELMNAFSSVALLEFIK